MLKSNVRAVVGVMVGALALTACGQSPKDGQAQLDRAVEEIRGGSLIRAMNLAGTERGDEKLEFTVDATIAEDAPTTNPCPALKTIEEFGGCLREVAVPASHLRDAVIYHSVFKTEKPLSSLSESELGEFLSTNGVDLIETFINPGKFNLRNQFSDEDLVELLMLTAARHVAYRKLELQAFAAADANAALIEEAAKTSTRWAVLLAMKANANDGKGIDTAAAITAAMGASTLPNLDEYPTELLHPYALMAVLPDEGNDADNLLEGEDPFELASSMTSELAGNPRIISKILGLYATLRDNDNPDLPASLPVRKNAARVAVMDSGLDFVTYPDLGLFAGNGSEGRMAQADFADADSNSWAPAMAGFAHGSGTAATVLTVMSHYAPEQMKARGVDLAAWKVSSIRSILAGTLGAFSNNFFDGRINAIVTGVLDRIYDRKAVRPHMVSVSLTFPTQSFLKAAGKENALLDAEWLWVMAAGNAGKEVKPGNGSCFNDVPSAQRPADRILCVGALKRGIVNDQIAEYSNWGDLVDVYAYESYTEFCPNGTSCATPAITGAAASLKAKFPSLTSEDLKAIIVRSAETRTLPVEIGTGPMAQLLVLANGGVPPTRTVKVFDPTTMMERAFKIARGYGGNPFRKGFRRLSEWFASFGKRK